MVTRFRTQWKPNSKGYYERQIGWKRSSSGKLLQHKFLLGTDLREAQRRERKLRELWDRFEASQLEERLLWPEALLEIAKRVAKGDSKIEIPRKPDEMQFTYADRIRRLQATYPVIAFLPADQHAYEVGQEALRLFAEVDTPSAGGKSSAAATKPVNGPQRAASRDGLGGGSSSGSIAAASRPPSAPKSGGKPGSLRGALREYKRWVEKEFFRPETGSITPWGRTHVRQIETLIEHHPDCQLSRLDQEGVEELIRYWRQRPLRKNTKRPMKAKAASNYIAQLKRFFRWLHRSSKYDWRRPDGYDEISTRVSILPTDHQIRLEQVDTFSIDELVLLMRYSQPLERLFLLLGLNCGFGTAEIARPWLKTLTRTLFAGNVE